MISCMTCAAGEACETHPPGYWKKEMRKKKRRLSYRAHTDEAIRNAIRAACTEGSILADYFESICLERVEGNSEYELGVAEGRRRLAGDILGIAMSQEADVKVEKNMNGSRDNAT